MARSRRAWGWHELDPHWATRLVADASLPRGALVLDVGAGRGAVTRALVDAGAHVIAVELHDGRRRELARRFGDDIRVVRADARDLRLPRRPFHVVANPPFGATAALVGRLLAPGSRLVSARLILEDHAAHRWAGPAAPAIGRWSRYHVTRLGPRVPRRAFRPRPRVDARVLRVDRRF